MASVTLNHVSKRYEGGVDAVHDVSLEIADGEFLILVGPSGCGKTTTLRMIAGLESITSGTISIGPREVNQVHPKDRDIAMVFQNYALYPHMSVSKNMAFALKMRKTPRDEIAKRVDWAAELLGLKEVLDRKPRALSGGQRQRVALGRAIVRKPAVYLFDEPLSNLDAKLRVEMRAEIKQLHRELQTTTIYVTHDQEEAMSLGDRVAVMGDGEVRQCGSPLNVYNRPADQFVAGFLGTPPMNFLDGDIVTDEQDFSFRCGEILLRVSEPATMPKLGAKVVAGIRPEAIIIKAPANSPTENCLNARVVDVEPIGAQMDVRLSTAHSPVLICRTPVRRISPDDQVVVELPADKIHLFDAQA